MFLVFLNYTYIQTCCPHESNNMRENIPVHGFNNAAVQSVVTRQQPWKRCACHALKPKRGRVRLGVGPSGRGIKTSRQVRAGSKAC